ncbi:RICIN domain-containing protein [Streptomyces sp. NPDC127020]|uniref:RICIN domain-containing protein n=1 Tax=Streptomyces sp. NPDC127020 TaxID=3347109 RepID=UPI003648617E
MHATRSGAVIATMLAGTLLAIASPAIAHDQPSKNSDPTPSREFAANRYKNLKSGKYLQAVSTANGARVVQQPYASTGLQTWEAFTLDGYYTFENFSSGRNLGIDRASTSAGAPAIIANPSADLNQDWTRDYSAYDGNYYALKNRKSGLCLGISGASTANGAQAAQFRCDGSTNQGWTSES